MKLKTPAEVVRDGQQIDLDSIGSMFDTWTGMTFPLFNDGEVDWDMGTHITDVNQEWLDGLDNWDKKLIDAWVMTQHDFGGLDKSNLS